MAKADPNQPCIDLNEDDGARIFENRNFNLVLDCDFGDIENFNSFAIDPPGVSERSDHPNENDLPASLGRFDVNGTRRDVFKVEPLTDGVYGTQHRRGPNGTEPGVRDDAWYNKKYDKVVQIDGDNLGSYLVQRGREITQSSLDAEYTDVPSDRDFNLCTSWLDTFSITDSGSGKVPNSATPNVTFGKRTYFELLVNFDEVKTPGFRHSWWLMPATNNAPDRGAVVFNDDGSFLDNTAYDGGGSANARNGVEIDIYEYEPIPTFEETLLMKAIPNLNLQENTQNQYSPPAFGSDPNALVTARGLRPGDLNDITYKEVNRGWVRIGFFWDDSETRE